MKIFNYKLTKFDIIGISIFGLFTLGMYIKSSYESKQLREHLDEKYEDITLSTQINGTVKDTYYPSDWRDKTGQRFVVLNNGRGINISINEYLEVEKEHIGYFVKPGAQILKSKGTDSLVVIYAGKRNFIKVNTD